MNRSEPFHWTLPGEPHAAQRPRVTRHGTYTPKESLQAQRDVALSFRVAYPRHLVADTESAWCLMVTFRRATRHRRDIDNLAKTVMDGLNGVLYRDDFQVTALHVTQVQVDKGAEATHVVAYPVGPGYWPRKTTKEETR